MLYSCSSLLFFLHCVMFLFLICEGKTPLLPKNSTIKAVFAFGDSIIDQGNNNNITTAVKCNFPPYGKDFVDGKATGRFSNAKTPADLIGMSFHVYFNCWVDFIDVHSTFNFIEPKLLKLYIIT